LRVTSALLQRLSPRPLLFLVLHVARDGAHRDLHSFPTRRSSDLKEIINHGKSIIRERYSERSTTRKEDHCNRIWFTRAWSCTKPDRKSTRLNSSHVSISYAVFCLKKKKNKQKLVLLGVGLNEKAS